MILCTQKFAQKLAVHLAWVHNYSATNNCYINNILSAVGGGTSLIASIWTLNLGIFPFKSYAVSPISYFALAESRNTTNVYVFTRAGKAPQCVGAAAFFHQVQEGGRQLQPAVFLPQRRAVILSQQGEIRAVSP